jgi:hypothetical protein
VNRLNSISQFQLWFSSLSANMIDVVSVKRMHLQLFGIEEIILTEDFLSISSIRAGSEKTPGR